MNTIDYTKLPKAEVIELLRDDEFYYDPKRGGQFMSSSNMGRLIKDPRNFFNHESIKSPALVAGGYFHTSILEPEKIDRFKISEAGSRNSKAYREEAGTEVLLLRKEQENILEMKDRMTTCKATKELIFGDEGDDVLFEEPSIIELEGRMFKGKADIINKTQGLIIDLKTTGELERFRFSAQKFNYDCQAYIYQKLFGMNMVFIAIDKTTHNMGIFTCSDKFIERGKLKVKDAMQNYEMIMAPDYNPEDHCLSETL